MSLKAFHVVFILASILLTLWFGFWQAKAAAETHVALGWLMTVLSFSASMALTVYLFWFIRKIKNPP